MSHKSRRYSLKSKEAKLIISRVSGRMKMNLEAILGTKPNIEVVEADFGQVFLIHGKPLLFKVGENVFPTLFFSELTSKMPKIVVDMGAVPYVCKGADVMAPGIVRIEGEFSKGGIVMVVGVKDGKALGLGESLLDSETARNTKKGAVVKTLHFVSDKIWDCAKTLVE